MTTRYRVTLANMVNENRHVTVHKTLELAEAYKQSYVDWQCINPDLITIEAIEDGEGNDE